MQFRFLRSPQSAYAPSPLDIAAYAFIFLIGAFQFTHYLRTSDFVVDATYPDMARSLFEQGGYRIRFLPQTTLPPGLPLILACVGRVAGFTPAGLFPVIAVSATLGLIFAYQLLREVEGCGVAATACLLFGTSPAMFMFSTTGIFPEMPYLLVSMLALLLALKIDRAEPSRTPIGWIVILSLAVVFAVLIRSVGIALVMGLGAWCATSLLMSSDLGWRRIKRFWAPMALGLTAQLIWGAWASEHQILEWQLPGYPNSYLSQLEVKNGQHPELGMARVADIPSRVARNVVARTLTFGEVLTHRYLSQFWSSPAVCGVLILISIGLASSLRNAGQLHDWYFLCYELIFLMWPWETKDRFLFPIVPLAFLYLCRGGKVVQSYAIRRPRIVGMCLVLIGSLLSLSSAGFALRVMTFPVNMRHALADRVEPVAAALFWALLTVLGVAILAYPALRRLWFGAELVRLRRLAESEAPILLRFALVLGVALLIGSGARQIVITGRGNLRPDITQTALYPEIEASAWILAHESSRRVIMAREPEFVFHYTHRRVVWFPPISDPKVLMDGIRRHRVDVVIVAHHSPSYWLPPEDDCFQALLHVYGNSFQLRHEGTDNWVYEVLPPQDRQ